MVLATTLHVSNVSSYYQLSALFEFAFQKMEFQIVIVAFLALVASTMMNVSASKEVITPPLCEPGILEEMPPHIKKVCNALENSNQLSTALNAYIRNEAAGKFSLF